jgi:hypothetical protein
MPPVPKIDHPWKTSSRLRCGAERRRTSQKEPRHFYARENGGRLYKFPRAMSRNEWVLDGKRVGKIREALTAAQARDSQQTVYDFDPERERILYDSGVRRSRRKPSEDAFD